MKIALYVQSWPPGDTPNGIVTYASQLVPALRRIGHEVFVLTPNKTIDGNDPYTIDLRRFASAPPIWDRTMFKLMPKRTSFNLASSAITTAIRELVEKHKLDVIEMEETYGFSFAISRLKLLPVVVRLHGPWFLNGQFNDPADWSMLNRCRLEWEGRGIRYAEVVTAPSAEVLQSVKDHYEFSLPGSRLIPNPFDAAVEAETWDVNSCSKDSLLFVGRFDRRKGGDLVLRVFSELVASRSNLKLTFIGPDSGIEDGNGNKWSFENFVRANISEWCQSRIEFCGHLNHSTLMSIRTKHFATIIASQYEIAPYSILEPMALGCPIVATAVGGIPELINDQKNGLLVPSQDVGAMTAACQKLLNDHALAARLGRQAWQDCCKFYRPDHIAKQTLVAYEQAIDSFRIRNVS